MKRVNRWPSPAAILAFIALLVALGGTAFAATGTIVNIADPTTATHIARVSASGALVTTGTGVVSGNVAPAPPTRPFNLSVGSFTDGAQTAQFAPTSATLALTGIRVANITANGTNVVLWEYGFPSGETTCSTSGSTVTRFLGEFAVPAGQTVEEPLTTPLILKPISSGGTWCLITFASGSTGSAFYTTYNGYVVSGTFAPAANPPALKPGAPAPTRRRR